MAVWQESKENKTIDESEAFGDFSPIRKQYERMLESLPDDSYRNQWQEQVGLSALIKKEEEEKSDVKTEDVDVKMEEDADVKMETEEDAKVAVKEEQQ